MKTKKLRICFVFPRQLCFIKINGYFGKMDLLQKESRAMKRSLFLLLFILLFGGSCAEEADSNLASCPLQCLCTQMPNEGTFYLVNCSFIGLDTMPQGAPPAAVEMHLSHNQLRVIPNFTFTMFSMLRKLYLDHNQIAEVQHDGFGKDYHTKLYHIDLSHNQMEAIPDNLPRSLKTLQLSHNHIERINAKSLTDQPNLQELYLDNNRVQSLHRNSFYCSTVASCQQFRFLPSLHKLSLTHNKISTLEKGVFDNLPWLEVLSLAHNRLTDLPKNAFDGLSNLRYLDLSHNKLTKVHPEALSKLFNLKFLYLSHNQLKTLPEGIPMVEWLDISHNSITHVSEANRAMLYPIEIFMFAQNPLHCDCNLLWLKELYDRREYILKHIDIPAQNFIPQCASPPALAGEAWDTIGDEVFNCKETLDMADMLKKQISEGSVDSNKAVHYNVKLEVKNVQPVSLTVHWTFEKSALTFYRVYLQYYQFGRRDSSLKHLQVKSAPGHYTVTDLEPSSSYVICVIPALNEASPLKVSLDSCTEAVTSQAPRSIFLTYILPIWSYIFYSLVTFLAVFCLIGLCGVVYGGLSMQCVQLWSNTDTASVTSTGQSLESTGSGQSPAASDGTSQKSQTTAKVEGNEMLASGDGSRKQHKD